MMCVTSLVTASKERQTGAKSCKPLWDAIDESVRRNSLPRLCFGCFRFRAIAWSHNSHDLRLAPPRLRRGLTVEDMSMTAFTWRALGQVVLVYFAVGGVAVTAQDTQPGRATFAEMIAFARLASVACQRLAPDADSFHALALRRFIKPSITEEEIAAKAKDVKRLRARLGLSRWCKRYAGEMEQARILVQVLRRQN